MKAKGVIGLGVAAVLALGLWLWMQHGAAVWLDAAMSFCL